MVPFYLTSKASRPPLALNDAPLEANANALPIPRAAAGRKRNWGSTRIPAWFEVSWNGLLHSRLAWSKPGCSLLSEFHHLTNHP